MQKENLPMLFGLASIVCIVWLAYKLIQEAKDLKINPGDHISGSIVKQLSLFCLLILVFASIFEMVTAGSVEGYHPFASDQKQISEFARMGLHLCISLGGIFTLMASPVFSALWIYEVTATAKWFVQYLRLPTGKKNKDKRKLHMSKIPTTASRLFGITMATALSIAMGLGLPLYNYMVIATGLGEGQFAMWAIYSCFGLRDMSATYAAAIPGWCPSYSLFIPNLCGPNVPSMSTSLLSSTGVFGVHYIFSFFLGICNTITGAETGFERLKKKDATELNKKINKKGDSDNKHAKLLDFLLKRLGVQGTKLNNQKTELIRAFSSKMNASQQAAVIPELLQFQDRSKDIDSGNGNKTNQNRKLKQDMKKFFRKSVSNGGYGVQVG